MKAIYENNRGRLDQIVALAGVAAGFARLYAA